MNISGTLKEVIRRHRDVKFAPYSIVTDAMGKVVSEMGNASTLATEKNRVIVSKRQSRLLYAKRRYADVREIFISDGAKAIWATYLIYLMQIMGIT